MSSIYRGQRFPLFDPLTEEHLGFKDREQVHLDGDWHKGIQAHIVRKKGDSFEILVQKRSQVVDIGKNKYDQSLATQMTDKDLLDEERALERGLRYELGITRYKHRKFLGYNLRIVKTYPEHPDYLNREILVLYLVEVDAGKPVILQSDKVSKVEWIEWSKFIKFYKKNRDNFTKTARFYLDEFEEEIYQQTCLLLEKKSTTDISEKLVIREDKNKVSTKSYSRNFL